MVPSRCTRNNKDPLDLPFPLVPAKRIPKVEFFTEFEHFCDKQLLLLALFLKTVLMSSTFNYVQVGKILYSYNLIAGKVAIFKKFNKHT